MVGIVTIGSVAVYRARAMLDAQAEFYVAKQVEVPREALRDAPRASAVANLAIEVRPDPAPAERAPATSPALAAPVDITAFPDLRGSARNGEQVDAAGSPDPRDAPHNEALADVTGAIAGKVGTRRLTTVYVHRGADAPAAYLVPRE